MSNKESKLSLESHACLLPGGAVAFIAITEGVAISLARSAYGSGSYTIVRAQPKHYAELLADSTK